MGRARIDIKKIENKAHRQTTFTKRRKGLFNKATELGNKFDADVAIIAFSLAGNVYAFGHPNFKSVLNRYDAWLEQNTPATATENVEELEDELKKAVARSEIEKSVGEVLETVVQSGGRKGKEVWDEAIENLGLAALEQLEATMKDMHNKVVEIKIKHST